MNKNTIPEMTHPLSKAWDQPNKSEIAIDDTHALMTERTFKQLRDYSASIPSGVYDGKMWRMEAKGINYLRWYSSNEDPNKCSINTREILITN